jgi:hypothetical protein
MPLGGSYGQLLPFPLECSIYRKIDREQTITHKSFHKDFGIVEVRIFPGRAIEPERAIRCFGQSYVFAWVEAQPNIVVSPNPASTS